MKPEDSAGGFARDGLTNRSTSTVPTATDASCLDMVPSLTRLICRNIMVRVLSSTVFSRIFLKSVGASLERNEYFSSIVAGGMRESLMSFIMAYASNWMRCTRV